MELVGISIPKAFWEYLSLTDTITGKDTSPEARALALACRVIPRKHGDTYTIPAVLTAQTAPVLGRHVDAVLEAFQDAPNRRDSALYRTARVLREKLDTALDALARPFQAPPAPADVEFTRWRLQGPHARRGAAVAVSKAIRETTGLMPGSVLDRGKYDNELLVSGGFTGVTIHMATNDPRHYDTEATYRQIMEGLDSRGYVLDCKGVQRDDKSEWAFIHVVGKRG